MIWGLHNDLGAALRKLRFDPSHPHSENDRLADTPATRAEDTNSIIPLENRADKNAQLDHLNTVILKEYVTMRIAISFVGVAVVITAFGCQSKTENTTSGETVAVPKNVAQIEPTSPTEKSDPESTAMKDAKPSESEEHQHGGRGMMGRGPGGMRALPHRWQRIPPALHVVRDLRRRHPRSHRPLQPRRKRDDLRPLIAPARSAGRCLHRPPGISQPPIQAYRCPRLPWHAS